jgi:zinc/manganese transport system ATP-binding protein
MRTNQPKVTATSFELQDVSVDLGGSNIWSQGTFSIESGSITAIIGPNGAGKTTLLKMILGLIPTTTGKLTVREREIGYVPQNYDTENDNLISAADYVRSCGIKYRGAELTKRVERALQQVEAEEFAKKRLSELSGGQRQRVAFAAALVSDNQMLCLDEPLSSLDIHSAHEIVALLERLNKELQITILIVAHDLALLLPILTGAIYLVDGHAHYSDLDDAKHEDYSDLLDHLSTMKVGEHEL